MVSKSTDSVKDEEETENLLNGIVTVGYSLSDLENILNKLVSHYTLIVKDMQPETRSRCRNEILQNTLILGFNRRLCEYTVHTNAKYSEFCTRLLCITASDLTLDNKIATLKTMEMRKFSEGLCPTQIRDNLSGFASECSLVSRNDIAVSGPVRPSIIRPLRESKSMVNVETSPLFQQDGVLGNDSDFRTLHLEFSKNAMRNNFMNSPSQSSLCSTSKSNKSSSTVGVTNSETEAKHRSFIYLSSSKSASTDKSSSSSASTVSLGMLHYTWKGLSPHFVFSVDERREVYVANPVDVNEISSHPFPDLTYLFYLKKHGKKDHIEEEPRLVGKMKKVATTLALGPNNSEIMETEIVLWGTSEISEQEIRPSESRINENKGLSRKVSKVLKNIRSSKQIMLPQIHWTSTMYENFSLERCQNVETVDADNVSESDLPPNLELAAIIIKDHIKDDHQKELGGWGLKFLKQVEVKKAPNTPDAALLSDCCAQDHSDCSSSMEIIVPAGLHGGPMTRHNGPSTLIERWKSGGCDCSGWDLGCPLTLFQTGPSKEAGFKETDDQEECKSFDVFVQGSEHNVPSLRITNVQSGLHVVHFQSTFSALQSFSIAVAYILRKSSFFYSKLHRN